MSKSAAIAAVQDAREAARRNRLRREQAERTLPEAREVIEDLRAINEANGYDRWLLGYIRRGK
jgi:hypothetical protein